MKPHISFLVTLIVIMGTLSSCKPEKVGPNGDAEIGMQKNGGLCVCSGYHLENNNGEYSCPGGSGTISCDKVVPCPCPALAIPAGNFNSNLYKKFTEALAENDLPKFFKGSKYKQVFPGLDQMPALLESLREGKATIVAYTPMGTSQLHYFFIPVLPQGIQYTINHILYAVDYDG